MNSGIFQDLFVMELANNHLGRVERGKKIINDFAAIITENEIKAAIKLQFRDVDNFIHRDFKDRKDIRYINKTLITKMSKEEYRELVDEIRKNNILVAATPFDEYSVALCKEFNIDIIKVASSDINDWILLSEIAKLEKPVIISTGGATEKDLDNAVRFLAIRGVDFAINHCVSLYPTEWDDIELNQIDYLMHRYNIFNVPIGFSTHEYDLNTMLTNVAIAVGKGISMLERHIDIEEDDIVVSPYCSTPDDIDKWIKSYKLAKRACGGDGGVRRSVSEKEEKYLDALKRGVYFKKDFKVGDVITRDDVYFAVPLQKTQISVKEFKNGAVLRKDVKQDEPMGLCNIWYSKYGIDGDMAAILKYRGV